MTMLDVQGSGETLGATVHGLDLARTPTDAEIAQVISALGRYGVLRFPAQTLEAANLADFSRRFGTLEVNVANAYQEPGLPEVMILSNMKRDGKPVGLQDAGQDWHTDMSYSRMIAFANVLYALEVPHRDGRPLGSTQFCNMHAAYDALSDDVKRRIEGRSAIHDFAKFWDKMRREKGSTRPPLTDQQRAAKPPVSQPLVRTHPITGKKVLYANPGYATRIEDMPQDESDALLEALFAHQTQERFCYTFRWTRGDVLMWENIGTIHNAVADYLPHEHRLIKRCQVMADRFYFPDGRPRTAEQAA